VVDLTGSSLATAAATFAFLPGEKTARPLEVSVARQSHPPKRN